MSSPHSAPDGSVGAASSTTPHTSPPESPKPSGHSAQAKESSAAARAPSSNQSQRTNGLRRIEEYELVESIGRGAMGQVFRAHDTLLDRPVAIKVIAAANPTETAQERFLIEARAIARLQHPNVVAIHRIGKHQNRLYIVSELLKGTSLDRIAIPMRWPRALDIAIGIARGLDAAHQNGVLHRDIKPAAVPIERDWTLIDPQRWEVLATTNGGSELDSVDRCSGAARPQKAPTVRSDSPAQYEAWYTEEQSTT